MKKALRVVVTLLVIASLHSAALAQLGYSVTDNNQDATGRNQQLYEINVANGTTTYIGELAIDVNGNNVIDAATERIRREYEGIASIGGRLYGLAEAADINQNPFLCTDPTIVDPITGLAPDLRIFNRPRAQTPPSTGNPNPTLLPNPYAPNEKYNIGPQIAMTCVSYGTESAMGYNVLDGFFYAIMSDDLFAATGVRSRLYRINPSTAETVLIGDVTNPSFDPTAENSQGDQFPYIDGFTITPNGTAWGTEMRFSNRGTQTAGVRDNSGLYFIPLTAGGSGTVEADFCKFMQDTDLNVDTGLANVGNTTLYVLNEKGVVYQTSVGSGASCQVGFLGNAGAGDDGTSATGGTPFVARNMTTPGAVAGEGAGGGAGIIRGCRGADAVTEFASAIGSCRDFEGFDIPTQAFR
jgi:hypothetical protein